LNRRLVACCLIVVGACAGRPRPLPVDPLGHDAQGSVPVDPGLVEPRRYPLPGFLNTVPVRLSSLDQATQVEIIAAGNTTTLRPVANGWSSGPGTRTEWNFEDTGGVRVAGRLHEGRVTFRFRGGRHAVLVHVPLEQYVEGVVAAELSLWSSEPAELEAQAIAARTYAVATLRQRERERADPERVFLWDGVEDQAYRGRFEPNASHGERDAASRLSRAIAATQGLILMREGAPADTRFHAACGGHTSDLNSVFPESGQIAPGVPCAPCSARAQEEVRSKGPNDTRPLAWKWTAPEAELTKLARQHGLGSRLTRLRPRKRDVGGRWLEIELEGPRGTKRVPFNDVRRALGFSNLRSTRILRTWPRQGEAITGGLAFVGLGYGHGVGLCQEGTRDLAQSGATSRAILRTYYPTAILQRLEPRGRPFPQAPPIEAADRTLRGR
jgi:stage II sporulation protein D